MSELFRRTVAATALALVLGAPVAAQDSAGPDLDTVVATVNGEEITLGHMLMVRASLPQQYQDVPNEVLWDGILDQLVQQQVLSQDDRAVETPRVRLAIENERRGMLAAEVIGQVIEERVTEEAVQAAYEAQFLDAEPGVEYNASHILLETEEAANEVIAALREGADFAELARERSTGPSGPNGGSLGWFGRGAMVAPFQEAVEAMEVGAVSEPVQTQFGWHVIQLNDTRTPDAPPLDQVRAEIENGLRQTVVTEYIEDRLSEAEVSRSGAEEIDPSILSQTDLLER